MTSSNNSSTDPAEGFPEVDDYSEVDELDRVAADLAAELRSSSGYAYGEPDAPIEPVAADRGDAEAAAPSPEEVAAALAEQVGLDLNAATPIAAGPIDLAEQGLTPDDGGDPVAARVGWFPPATDTGDVAGHAVAIEPAPTAPEPPTVPQAPPAGQEDDARAGHPVDQIAVRKLGGFNFLSIGQWSASPRDERARLLKGNLVMFLFDGEEVPVRPALVWLQQLARAESAGQEDPPTRRRGR